MGQQIFWSRRQGRLDGIHWVDHNILDLTNQDVAKHPCGKRSRMRADKKLMDLMLGVLDISCVYIFIQNWTNVAPLRGGLPDSKSSKPGQLMAEKATSLLVPSQQVFINSSALLFFGGDQNRHSPLSMVCTPNLSKVLPNAVGIAMAHLFQLLHCMGPVEFQPCRSSQPRNCGKTGSLNHKQKWSQGACC